MDGCEWVLWFLKCVWIFGFCWNVVNFVSSGMYGGLGGFWLVCIVGEGGMDDDIVGGIIRVWDV